MVGLQNSSFYSWGLEKSSGFKIKRNGIKDMCYICQAVIWAGIYSFCCSISSTCYRYTSRFAKGAERVSEARPPAGALFIGNISGANQSLRANRVNFNLGHRINIQGEARGEWEGDLQKYDYPIQGRAVNCKITQSLHTPWMLIRYLRLKFARFARIC